MGRLPKRQAIVNGKVVDVNKLANAIQAVLSTAEVIVYDYDSKSYNQWQAPYFITVKRGTLDPVQITFSTSRVKCKAPWAGNDWLWQLQIVINAYLDWL